MRHLFRLLRSTELLFVLPIIWVIAFSWPLLVEPDSFTSGGLFAYLVATWSGIVAVLALMSIAHAQDDSEPGEDL